MWFGPLIMFDLPLLAILLIFWVIAGRSQIGPTKSTHDPRAILDERFARGEIDEDEYRHRRSAIDS